MTIPRSRDLRLLAGAAGLSALGDFLALIPLVLHVQQRTGSTFAVSAVFFALWAPVVLGAGLAGAIVDRFENRALLVGVSFAQAAVVGRASRSASTRCGRCCRSSRCSASASRSASRPSSRSCPPRPARPTSRAPTG